jgi:glycosyltransferase involved in cell wall biosynthesis
MALHQPVELPARDAEAEAPILFVTRKWAPAVGGMETYALRLTQQLAESSPVEVIALPGRADGMPPSALELLGFPFTVLRHWLARKTAPAVLHIGDMALWPLGLLARGRVKVVLSAHGTDVSYPRRGGIKGALYGHYLKLGSRLLARAEVIANSHATRDVAAETGWRNAAVVPLATDLRAAPPDGRHNGKILFAGRLIPLKGCAWFIRQVLPLLPEGTRLQVAGTRWNGDEAAALDHPRVEYLGTLDRAELGETYRNAMCVIVPNIVLANGEYEGFGLVAPEAAAAGGLVLAARCGGLSDAVIDGETGLLVEAGNAAAWRDAIVEVSAWDRKTRKAFLDKAMQTAAEHFSWDRVARETLALYGAVPQ